MTRYRLTALRYSQIVDAPKGGPIEYARRRRGDVFELDDAEAERLLKAGAVERVDDEQPVDDGEPGEATAADVDEAGRGEQPVDDAGEPLDPADISAGPKGAVPPRAGAKPLWVDYAVANGMPRPEAEEMTKPELIARFGGGN
ncbi:hypothetical protein [Nocardia sp. NPDC057455]|uniref:hypothetical protein n=1 Tax=Nocardia sp. NPDC057455 TaxID=3346138 RepID=UPI00366D3DB7